MAILNNNDTPTISYHRTAEEPRAWPTGRLKTICTERHDSLGTRDTRPETDIKPSGSLRAVRTAAATVHARFVVNSMDDLLRVDSRRKAREQNARGSSRRIRVRHPGDENFRREISLSSIGIY